MRLLIVLTALALAVRAGGLEYICNSAPGAGARVLVHADVADFTGRDYAARFFYSTDSQASWTERTMARLGTPGYDSTWQGEFFAPGSGVVWYYLQVDDGPHRATQSPSNSGNAWPPGDNLLALACDDPVGDTFNGAEGPWLDLTGVWLGYSASHFYFLLTNNHDSWPTSGGLLKWYSYSVGFANPNAPSDTWVFAPVYVDAWPVMQHGLFAVNRYSGELPERVGDIERQTSGNRLFMRCLISDLTADRRFGPWPNAAGWLACAANTQTITTGGASSKDTSATGVWYGSRTQRFVVGTNTAPALSAHGVTPDSGGTATVFNFSVRYTDADTNLPVARAVVIDRTDTLELAPDNHAYGRGVFFRAAQNGFAGGWHEYFFRFDDGMSVVSTPPDSFYVYSVGCQELEPRAMAGVLPTVTRGVLRLRGRSVGSLLDITGKRVMSTQPGENSIAHLGPGVYWLVDRVGPTPRKVVLLP